MEIEIDQDILEDDIRREFKKLLEDLNNKKLEDKKDYKVGIEIPPQAFDENGELKENYRKAYKTVIEDYREANHKEYEEAPEPVEIADATTMDLKYIINSLIENTGIINSVRLRFKKSQTATILKTLAQYETMLNNHFLTWSIKSYYDEEGLELNFTRE